MDVDDLLDELCALVDKSVLIRTEVDGTVRFRLLATLRDYGRAHVGSADEYRRLQRRHLDWYRRLLSKARSEFFSENQVQWIETVRREMANLHEALQFGLTDSPETVLEMTAAMRFVWVATGMLQEGRRWVEQALNATRDTPAPQRVNAVAALGVLAVFQADWATATACVEEARALVTEVTDPRTRGLVDTLGGFGALLRGEVEQAQASAERALESSDDFEVQIFSRLMLSWRFAISGAAERALSCAEQALALAESRGETVMRNYMLASVGISRFALGDLSLAARALQEGLQRCRLIGDAWTGAQFLEMLAWIAAADHAPRRAAVLMSASASVSRASGTNSTTMALLGLFHQECERQVHSEMAEAEFKTASLEGGSLSFDEAAAVALAQSR